MPTCVCVWQYPGEEETVWNACSFLQHLPGRDEVVLPPGGGVVRIFHVLVSANSRAETVEELEGRRKRVVVQVLETLRADVCRAVDAAATTEEFKKRLAQDKYPEDKDDFINSIKNESAERVEVFKALPDGAYAEIETLGEAVSKGLTLRLLANAKLRLWLEDPSLNLYVMSDKECPVYLGLNAAQGRRLARRRLLLQDSSSAGRCYSIDRVGRIVVEDRLGRMGGTATAALALEDCRERLLVTGAGDAALKRKDPYTLETPLIAQVRLGEYENVKRLLQAGADANATTAGGERALLIAAKEGREDLVTLLAGFLADLNARDAQEKTVLHWASQEGHPAAVQALLEAGADMEAKSQNGETSLHRASENGRLAVVQTLLEHGADVAARSDNGWTSLHWASENGHLAVVQTLLEDGADVAARDNNGRTSLLWASKSGHLAVVQMLLEDGDDVAARDNYGRTPVDYACNEEVKAVFFRHSLLLAAQFGKEEFVAEHIAQGADLAARDGCGRTALVVACAHGQRAAAALLVEPTKAADALDAVGRDGFSALMWAEDRGLDGVALSLRECVAAPVRRPALALFRGEAGAVQVDLEARTVAFTGSFATVRSAQRCPLGGKGYYELEILETVDSTPQYGFAAPAFVRVLGAQSGEGVGDDVHSWSVDGARQLKFHVSGDADVDKTNTARLSEAFVGLDRDGDGVLSLAEFTPLAKAMGFSEENVQQVFSHIDTDSNGVVSESEFHAFFRQALGCEREREYLLVLNSATWTPHDLDGLGDEAQKKLEQLLQMLCMLKDRYTCTWQAGDVIGLACDLDKMQMHVSLNGSFAAPHGVVFELAPDAAAEGLFAAFSGKTGKVRFNLNEADFRHAPPAADFQAYATFER